MAFFRHVHSERGYGKHGVIWREKEALNRYSILHEALAPAISKDITERRLAEVLREVAAEAGNAEIRVAYPVC